MEKKQNKNRGLVLALLLLVGLSGRLHGIGGIPFSRIASLVILTAGMALGGYWLWGWYAVPLAAITAFGFSTGHGRFFAMNGANTADPNPEWIEKYCVLWWYRGDITKPRYSWVCMGVKGLMIGAPIMPSGLLFGLAWPASYAFGMRYFTSTALGEWLSTFFAATMLVLIRILG